MIIGMIRRIRQKIGCRPELLTPACPPPASAVRYLAEVGAKGGECGSSVGLDCLDVGGLGGLTLGVL